MVEKSKDLGPRRILITIIIVAIEITIWKNQQKRKLDGPHKRLKMRNLHGALMMNVDPAVGTWRFLGFIHAKRLSS
jgi:hypothetical protein